MFCCNNLLTPPPPRGGEEESLKIWGKIQQNGHENLLLKTFNTIRVKKSLKMCTPVKIYLTSGKKERFPK